VQCSVLSAKVPGKVFYSTSTTYNTSMEGFWSLQATFDDPSCILRPTVNTDVATAVKALASASCQFSVKGGGHTPWKGAASIDNGVMIDMTTINSTVVNAAGNVASIGAGARWGQIYTTLIGLGKMVAGGRDSDVGIGGLVIGGGYSWFTSKMGFVADGVVNFELVTGAGAIINVNATSNADLFVGLKGGGNNFGIVTRYDLKCFDFGLMWGGLKLWPESSSAAQIAAFVNFTNYAHTDTSANLINYWSYNQKANTSTIANVMQYTKPIANPSIYDQVNAIPGMIVDTTRIANIKSYTDELSSSAQRDK
jgi:FAD/FMN-containing dehydrogenase